ncbi:MAG: hypothetical protein JWR05_3542 [Mucilaginibacter sp.]|nr:hypothetical protein [Mucilaginibacter sp.]
MKPLFDYLKYFQFKNLLAVFLIYYLVELLKNTPALHDSCIVLLTLVVKYYYDASTGSTKKDETISKALDNAQQTPGIPVNPNGK